jgi:hypothetical protein
MPNLPISGLPNGGALTGTELLVTVQSGNTVQIEATDILNYVTSSIPTTDTGSFAVTGSNQFNGNQIITGSLTTTGNVIVGTGIGDEGGEINLAYSQNTTLTGSAANIDVFQDRIRIFEGGGNSRGVYIDLSKAPVGNIGELLWKTSGIVDAGTFVTLDNLKATVASSGDRGLSIAATSTTFSANISATYGGVGATSGDSINNLSITTTPTTSLFGWNFVAEGEGAIYLIFDKTNNRMYRVTMMIGPAYLNNFISIERLI